MAAPRYAAGRQELIAGDMGGQGNRIGIVGGGLMGLALAQKLAARGQQVSIFERAPQVGGLATWQNFGAFDWDRFYHVILPTDVELIGLIKSIGLEDQLCWKETKTGFYVDRQFHPMNDTRDFLRFPLLSLWSKFRLALTLLYGSRINDWKRLERIPVEEWLIRVSGRATYQKMWRPLLLAKLGENYRRVSAVFIWSYIKRLFSARDSSARKEHMGYVHGGYKNVFGRLLELIENAGGRVHNDVSIESMASDDDGGVWLYYDGQREHFDRVVFTGPLNVLQDVADPGLISVRNQGRGVEYLGVVCMVTITKRPVTPFYVVNIADKRIPFTGVVGMSSIVDTDQTAGRYITYFPKYILSTDELLQQPEQKLRAEFMRGFELMYPEFDPEDIEEVFINRALKVQPLQVLGYSRLVPNVSAGHPDFYVLNTSQFVNNTLNNNEVVKSVEAFMRQHGEELCGEHTADMPQPAAAVVA